MDYSTVHNTKQSAAPVAAGTAPLEQTRTAGSTSIITNNPYLKIIDLLIELARRRRALATQKAKGGAV